MLFYLEGGLVFLTMLSILVATHEFGHYLFARLFKMGVEEFSIGMFGSKPIVTYMRRKYRIPVLLGEDPGFDHKPEGFSLESANTPHQSVLIETAHGPMLEETTIFTVRPAPIGGFVRIKGMLPAEDGSEVRIPGGFYSKPPWQRLIVLFAGPMFSVIAGVLVMIPIFMSVGVLKPDLGPIIGNVKKDGPAAKAGLRTYDRIVELDSQKISSFYEVTKIVQGKADQPLKVVYERGGKQFTTTVIPELGKTATPILDARLDETKELSRHGMLQVAPLYVSNRLSLADASISALEMPVEAVSGLVGVLRKPSTAQNSVGGPGTMLKITSEATQEGFVEIAKVAAVISISVGIFNLLPVQPLDGGQMVVAFVELLRGGRRLSLQVQNMVLAMGVATVFVLVVCAVTVDVGRLRSDPEPKPQFISKQRDLP